MGKESEKVQSLLKRFSEEFTVHINTGLVNKSEKCRQVLLHKLSHYVLIFTMCLLSQCTAETELFICGGQLISSSYSVISRLQQSTKNLDFRGHIRFIYSSAHNIIKRSSMVSKELNTCIYAGYNETVGYALYTFGLYVQYMYIILLNPL